MMPDLLDLFFAAFAITLGVGTGVGMMMFSVAVISTICERVDSRQRCSDESKRA